MMEDKIYTTDELIDMDVYTSDFAFMDKACEVKGNLIIKGAARKGMYRLFFLLEDGRKIIAPVFRWQKYLNFFDIPIGTELVLVFADGRDGKTYLKKMEPVA